MCHNKNMVLKGKVKQKIDAGIWYLEDWKRLRKVLGMKVRAKNRGGGGYDLQKFFQEIGTRV